MNRFTPRKEEEIAIRQARSFIINLYPHTVTDEDKLQIERIFINIAFLRDIPGWGGALVELEELTRVIKLRNE